MQNVFNKTDLTPDLMLAIKAAPYEELLYEWRFAPIGAPMFSSDVGPFLEMILERRTKETSPSRKVEVDMRIGWP